VGERNGYAIVWHGAKLRRGDIGRNNPFLGLKKKKKTKKPKKTKPKKTGILCAAKEGVRRSWREAIAGDILNFNGMSQWEKFALKGKSFYDRRRTSLLIDFARK